FGIFRVLRYAARRMGRAARFVASGFSPAARRHAIREAVVNVSLPAKSESPPPWFAETMATLLERRELSDQQMRLVLHEMMRGSCGEVETAALLTALRMKGETACELAVAAAVLREQMIRFETGRADVVDTCGIGG